MTNQTVIKVGSTATGFWGKFRTVLARRTEGRAIVLFAIIATFVTVSQPLVFTAYQVTLGRIALIGLVALGLTAVILMGELDLSVASTLAVSGVIAVTVANQTNMAIGVLSRTGRRSRCFAYQCVLRCDCGNQLVHRNSWHAFRAPGNGFCYF